MKGFKKLTLATVISAAPFVQAEMVAIEDEALAGMTGQAGITIDVDLQMSIDAIKYVDQDGVGSNVLVTSGVDSNGDNDFDDPGDTASVYGTQGAITAKNIRIGSFVEDSVISDWPDANPAQIRGVTIDADGTKGLVIGVGSIGDTLGNGIDVTVDSITINGGYANKSMVEAAASTTFDNSITGTSISGTLNVGEVSAALTELRADAVSTGTAAATAAGAYSLAQQNTQLVQNTAANNLFGEDYNNLSAADREAVNTEQSVQDAQAAEANAGTQAASVAAAYAVSETELNKALAIVAPAGDGNIGGMVIEDFRNYIQDEMVGKYNGVFDMVLMDSQGNVTGGSADAGRYVKGEVVIEGTGNSLLGTAGLAISGKFGGAVDRVAWVDEGKQFGVKDMGFFHGVDTDGDTIADTIEGMHFAMGINVVEHQSAVEENTTVAALALSDMKLQGTIMMGDVYLGGVGVSERSLGSVLVKDIDMTGTTVFVYGH